MNARALAVLLTAALITGLPALAHRAHTERGRTVPEHQPPPERRDATKRLVCMQSTPSARPWNMDDPGTLEWIDGLPFDGIAFNLPISWHALSNEYPAWSEEQIRGQFGALDHSFENVTQNLVAIHIRKWTERDPDGSGAVPSIRGDLFDDEAWRVTCEQLELLARVTSDPKYQCVGFVFDNETYHEPVWDYPADVSLAEEYDVDAYRRQAERRGSEFMEAIVRGWPEAVVIVMHGPYVSAPERLGEDVVVMNQTGAPDEYELLAPFFCGLVAGAGERAEIVDGGEVYQLRTREQFAANYRWRKARMPLSRVVPEPLRGSPYLLGTTVSFGLYPYTWPDAERGSITPDQLADATTFALERADDWVWVFSEQDRDLLRPGGADPAWIDAIRRGRERADRLRRDPLLELPEAERERILGLDEEERFAELMRLYVAD